MVTTIRAPQANRVGGATQATTQAIASPLPIATVPIEAAIQAATALPQIEQTTNNAPRTSPAGLVYTFKAGQPVDGKWVIAACVANIGTVALRDVEVIYAAQQPDVVIQVLRAPLMPSEVSANQARVIVSEVLPNQQVQIEVVIASMTPLQKGALLISVPKAYHLTDRDPALTCNPRPINQQPPEPETAQFLVGGEPVRIDQAAQLLEQSGAITLLDARSQGERNSLFTIPSSGLTMLVVSLAGALAILLLLITTKRQ